MRLFVWIIASVICVSCATNASNATRIDKIELVLPKMESTAGNSLVYLPDGWDRVKETRIMYFGKNECVIYYPEFYSIDNRRGIVVISNGYYEAEEDDIKINDGAAYKDLNMIKSWALALAAKGIPAITYDSNDTKPARGEKVKGSVSTDQLIEFLKNNERVLGIDSTRIGILSNGFTANRIQLSLSEKTWTNRVKCIVYNYPLLDDKLMPNRNINTLVIRSGDLGPGMLFAIDDYIKNATMNGLSIETQRNETGGFNYDSVVKNDETRYSINRILDYFEKYINN